MRYSIWLVLGAALVAAACAHRAFVPVAHVVTPTESLVAEGGGYAFLALRRGSRNRNLAACAALNENVAFRWGSADGRPEVVDDVHLFHRPIYVPVRSGRPRTCRDVVGRYDFDRAAVQLSRLGGSGGSGQGPFVIVRRANHAQAGLFDFSNVAAEDFDEQLGVVVHYLSQRSDFWQNAVHEATFRQWARQLILERTGQAPDVVIALLPFRQG